jgi:hypothetical protein
VSALHDALGAAALRAGLALVHEGLVKAYLPVADLGQKITIGSDPQPGSAPALRRPNTALRYIQYDPARVGSRSYHEIVFKLPALIAVVDQVHSRVNAEILHPGVIRHIRAPLIGVAADEVVTLARQLIRTRRGRIGTRPGQFHA